jgi:Uma2 family endonuclease
MAFLIDEAFLPATLTAHAMTDEEFLSFCAEHPDLSFEMTADGELIVMPPTRSLTDARNFWIMVELGAWVKKDRRGTGTGSSGGFVLPNGARRSPDAAWTSNARLSQLTQESLKGFWHLSPDFVIELKSETDRLRVLRKKMEEWIANGTQLGWLIIPETHTVEVFRPNREPEVLTGVDSVHGEGPVDGFDLDLRSIWNPLG